MKTKKELYEKYLSDLKDLQKKCTHPDADWMEQHWAPGHSTGKEVRVCRTCELTLASREMYPHLITVTLPIK